MFDMAPSVRRLRPPLGDELSGGCCGGSSTPSRRPRATERRRARGLDSAWAPGGRIRAEELHRALLGVQRPHRVGQQFVGDVRLGVDDEAVVAEAAGLGRAAREVRQVDPAGRELLQDRHEAARLVGALVDDERGLVVAGGCRDAVTGHDDEPGLVVLVVGDVGGDDLEAVHLGRDTWTDGGRIELARVRSPAWPRRRCCRRPGSRRRAAARGGSGGTAPWRPGSRTPRARRRVSRPGLARRQCSMSSTISRWISRS